MLYRVTFPSIQCHHQVVLYMSRRLRQVSQATRRPGGLSCWCIISLSLQHQTRASKQAETRFVNLERKYIHLHSIIYVYILGGMLFYICMYVCESCPIVFPFIAKAPEHREYKRLARPIYCGASKRAVTRTRRRARVRWLGQGHGPRREHTTDENEYIRHSVHPSGRLISSFGTHPPASIQHSTQQ